MYKNIKKKSFKTLFPSTNRVNLCRLSSCFFFFLLVFCERRKHTAWMKLHYAAASMRHVTPNKKPVNHTPLIKKAFPTQPLSVHSQLSNNSSAYLVQTLRFTEDHVLTTSSPSLPWRNTSSKFSSAPLHSSALRLPDFFLAFFLDLAFSFGRTASMAGRRDSRRQHTTGLNLIQLGAGHVTVTSR